MSTVPAYNSNPLLVSSSTTIAPNTFNTIYVQANSPISITLPDLTGPVTNGFPFLIVSFTSAVVTILDSTGNTVSTLSNNSMVILIADKGLAIWRGFLGPNAGTGQVSGPASSTNNAVAVWNGTSGQLLSNSAVTIDSTGTLFLPSAGGTSTGLNYFEEYSAQYELGGIWTAYQPCTVQIMRIGKKCFFTLTSAPAQAVVSGLITMSPKLPTRFLPEKVAFTNGVVEDNGNLQNGMTILDATGLLTIFSQFATFSGTGNSGIYSLLLCYNTN